MQGVDVQPRYEVEFVDEQVTDKKTRYVRPEKDAQGNVLKAGHFEIEEVEVPFGYMVYFPQGHSLRVKTLDELRRMGYHKQPGLVDMESGEVIKEDTETLSLKDRVLRKTSAPRARAPKVR